MEFRSEEKKLALELLNSFFEYRADGYRKKMSCPNEAETACSRLSPHIAFGSISLRKVYQSLSDALITSNFKNDLYSLKNDYIGIVTSYKSWRLSQNLNTKVCTHTAINLEKLKIKN